MKMDMLEHRTYVELDMLNCGENEETTTYIDQNNENNFSVEQHVDL